MFCWSSCSHRKKSDVYISLTLQLPSHDQGKYNCWEGCNSRGRRMQLQCTVLSFELSFSGVDFYGEQEERIQRNMFKCTESCYWKCGRSLLMVLSQ